MVVIVEHRSPYAIQSMLISISYSVLDLVIMVERQVGIYNGMLRRAVDNESILYTDKLINGVISRDRSCT